jgi:nitrogen fixation protein FixH
MRYEAVLREAATPTGAISSGAISSGGGSGRNGGGADWPPQPKGDKSGWRFMPLAIAIWLTVVGIMDGWMSWRAMDTFPGQTENGYDASNGYNGVLHRADLQKELGWRLSLGNRAGQVHMTLKDASGRPVTTPSIQAHAYRVVGPEERTPLTFAADGAGGQISAEHLALGQWAIDIELKAEGHVSVVTKRFFVR